MRAFSQNSKKKLLGFAAGAGVVALAIGGASGLSALADPTDVSEGQGKFLDGEVAGVDLDTLVSLANALAENPSGVAAADVPLTATALNAVTVSLPAIDLLGDNGILQLGAVEQFAQADANGDAFAGSGAVSDSSGAIAIDDAPGEGVANASLDASGLLAELDLDEVASALRFEIGALASRAEEVGGVVDSEYLINGLTLDLESAVVEDLYGSLSDAIAGLDTSDLTDALNDLDLADLGITLGPLASVDVTAGIGVTLPSLSDLLTTGVIENATGSVGVDLASGLIEVDIEQLLIDQGLDINNLPANTPLLSGDVLDDLTAAVLSSVTSIVQGVLNQVVGGIGLTGTVSLAVSILAVPLATVDLDVSGTLAAPVVTADAGGVVGDVLTDLLEALGIADLATLETTLETLIGLVGSGAVVDTLESTVQGLLATLDIATLLDPVLDVLSQVVGLTANVQPTAPPINAATGDLPGGSFTVRALQIQLLGVVGATPLAVVDLASSTVRGTIAAVDVDTDADADADVDAPDTEADADADVDVDVDAPDADVDADADADADADTETDADAGGPLAYTGSDGGLWLGGLGILALLTGAGLYLMRRRTQQS